MIKEFEYKPFEPTKTNEVNINELSFGLVNPYNRDDTYSLNNPYNRDDTLDPNNVFNRNNIFGKRL